MFSLTSSFALLTSLRSLAGAFGSLASHDNQLISNFINFNFFFIKHHSMYVEVCSCIRAQSISEYQLLGISRWFFSLIRQIEIDQGVKRIEIGQIQLCSRVIIIFPHCISHDIPGKSSLCFHCHTLFPGKTHHFHIPIDSSTRMSLRLPHSA